jgi:hypothetical protein
VSPLPLSLVPPEGSPSSSPWSKPKTLTGGWCVRLSALPSPTRLD